MVRNIFILLFVFCKVAAQANVLLSNFWVIKSPSATFVVIYLAPRQFATTENYEPDQRGKILAEIPLKLEKQAGPIIKKLLEDAHPPDSKEAKLLKTKVFPQLEPGKLLSDNSNLLLVFRNKQLVGTLKAAVISQAVNPPTEQRKVQHLTISPHPPEDIGDLLGLFAAKIGIFGEREEYVDLRLQKIKPVRYVMECHPGLVRYYQRRHPGWEVDLEKSDEDNAEMYFDVDPENLQPLKIGGVLGKIRAESLMKESTVTEFSRVDIVRSWRRLGHMTSDQVLEQILEGELRRVTYEDDCRELLARTRALKVSAGFEGTMNPFQVHSRRVLK